MATIPTPKTWTDGPKITKVDLDTEIRDDFTFLLERPQVRVSRAANFSIPTSGTSRLMQWDSEDQDNDGVFTLAANTRLTIVTPGIYSYASSLRYAANGGGVRGLHIRLNAAGVLAGGTVVDEDFVQTVPAGAGPNACVISRFGDIRLVVNDHLEMWAYQDSGGALNIEAGAEESYFGIKWEGE